MPEPVKCLHCGEVVAQYTGVRGTSWVHEETGEDVCRPTYAAPDFMALRAEVGPDA